MSATTTSTITTERVRLSGFREVPVETFQLAQDYGLPPDPHRLEAANVHDWDYSRGNPPNPIAGVVDISLRPNNAVGFVFNTFIYVMFRGVSVIYVCTYNILTVRPILTTDCQ